jgi:MFS transporter, SET family, sugar efflux transporter
MNTPVLLSQLRRWYPLGLVFLTTGFSLSMAYPFLTLFLTTAVRADPVHVSVFLVAGPVTGMVVAQWIGRLSDRSARRRLLLFVAAVAGVAAMAVYAFVRDYWILLGVAATVTAVAGSLMSQGFGYARAAISSADRPVMTLATLRMLFSLAWVGGPPLAALLLSVGGFSALYLTAAGMYAIAAIVTLAMLPEPAEVAAQQSAVVAEPAQNAPSRTIAGTIVAFAVLQGAGSAGVQMMPLFLAADLHAGVREAGLILGLCAGLEIPLMLAFGVLSTRWPLRRLIVAGPVFGAAYLALAATATHSWILFAGQLFSATSIAAIQGLGVSYVQDLMPSQPGRASALFVNSFAAGTIMTGPLIASGGVFGYRIAYLIAAGVSLVGCGLIAISRPPRVVRVPGTETAADPAGTEVIGAVASR